MRGSGGADLDNVRARELQNVPVQPPPPVLEGDRCLRGRFRRDSDRRGSAAACFASQRSKSFVRKNANDSMVACAYNRVNGDSMGWQFDGQLGRLCCNSVRLRRESDRLGTRGLNLGAGRTVLHLLGRVWEASAGSFLPETPGRGLGATSARG